MSSLLRRQQRKLARVNGSYETKPRAFKYHKDGSYEVLRPTKGWLRVSAARLRAQLYLSRMGEAIQRRKPRSPVHSTPLTTERPRNHEQS